MLSECLFCENGINDPSNRFDDEGQITRINCDYCGEYELLDFNPDRLDEWRNVLGDDIHLMSGIIREASETKNNLGYLDLERINEHIKFRAPKSLPAKAKRLLYALERRSLKSFGSHCPLDYVSDLALGFCKHPLELQYLLDYLCDLGWAKKVGSESHNGSLMVITPSGWEELERATGEDLNNSNVFVAMPLDKETKPFQEKGFSSAIMAAGYHPIIMGSFQHDNFINVEIMSQIPNARFAIADLTDNNPNVYFEAGFAMGLGKRVLYTVRSDFRDKKKVSFDLEQMNSIAYDTPEDLAAKLEDFIVGLLGKGPLKVSS